MTHLALVLALIWYALVPTIARTSASEGPSLRGQRSSISAAPAVVRAAPRESARAPRVGAPALPAGSGTPAVVPPSFARLSAPIATFASAPDPIPFPPVARGPPAR